MRTSRNCLLFALSTGYAYSFSTAPLSLARAGTGRLNSADQNDIFVLHSLRENTVTNNFSSARNEKAAHSNRTEVSRMKFMINQMKGTMKESEMRATAAEHRVGMLQKQLRDLENNAESEENTENSREKMADLKKGYE